MMISPPIDRPRRRATSWWGRWMMGVPLPHRIAFVCLAVLLQAMAVFALLVAANVMDPPAARLFAGRSVRQWANAVGSEDPDMRLTAVRMLVEVGDAAEPWLIAKLRAGDPHTRRDAALVLKKIRPTSKRAAQALADALEDRDVWVRLRAAQALRAMGQAAQPAVLDLASAMQDEDPRIRVAAAHALGNIGPRALRAHPALIEAMRDKRTYVRRAAADAMEKIVPETN